MKKNIFAGGFFILFVSILLFAMPAEAAEEELKDSEKIWQNAFLILSTGRAEYRDSYSESEKLLVNGDSKALEFIVKFFDPEIPREWYSLQRIAEVGGEICSDAFLHALSIAETDTKRVPIIFALGKTQNKKVINAIHSYQSNTDTRIRAAVAAAYGELAALEAKTPLLQLISDSSFAVRRIAVDSLARIQKKFPLEFFDSETFEIIERLLNDIDPWVKRKAIMLHEIILLNQ